MSDEDFITEEGVVWNSAQLYNFTLGKAITDTNRLKVDLKWTHNPKMQGLLYQSYLKSLIFVAGEMILSPRFDTEEIGKLLDDLENMSPEYSEEGHRALNRVYRILSQHFNRCGVMEPSTTKVDGRKKFTEL